MGFKVGPNQTEKVARETRLFSRLPSQSVDEWSKALDQIIYLHFYGRYNVFSHPQGWDLTKICNVRPIVFLLNSRCVMVPYDFKVGLNKLFQQTMPMWPNNALLFLLFSMLLILLPFAIGNNRHNHRHKTIKKGRKCVYFCFFAGQIDQTFISLFCFAISLIQILRKIIIIH